MPLNSCDGIYSDSLDVRFTKACDNNCPFCIEKTGIAGCKPNIQKMIESTLHSKKKTILILGGEPFLLIEELYVYISAIRPYVQNIYITTSLPKTIVTHYGTFEKIMALIDGLNISIQHFDDELNNKLLHASNPYKRIQGLLKNICQNKEYAGKIRVNVNLVKGFIDNRSELKACLYILEKLGVQNVKINELQHEEKLYVSYEKIMDITLKSPYSHGCQHPIYIEGIALNLTLKRACFCVNHNLQANFSDLMKAFRKRLRKSPHSQMVLYENGDLSQGWKTKEIKDNEKKESEILNAIVEKTAILNNCCAHIDICLKTEKCAFDENTSKCEDYQCFYMLKQLIKQHEEQLNLENQVGMPLEKIIKQYYLYQRAFHLACWGLAEYDKKGWEEETDAIDEWKKTLIKEAEAEKMDE